MPQIIHSISNQAVLSKQILSTTPIELQNVERSVFMKEVSTQNFCSFELRTQEIVNIPIWIIVGFQQRDRQDSQNLNTGDSYRPPITSAQSVVSAEKYLDSGIFFKL